MASLPFPTSREADLALRDRCLARPADRLAWDDLYRRYAPVVRARILHGRRAFPDHDVEDVVQAIFLKLATGALERFEGRASLKAYLVTIADSVRISENRQRLAAKRGEGRLVSLNGFPDASPSNGTSATGSNRHGKAFDQATSVDDPEILFLRQRRNELVHRAVSLLADARDREIVSLYFAEEPCVDREIAERLGMPLNTVTWRRLRAMNELRKRLARLERDPS
jgi:RNA polymerase sigma factor (sigma-70 family)